MDNSKPQTKHKFSTTLALAHAIVAYEQNLSRIVRVSIDGATANTHIIQQGLNGDVTASPITEQHLQQAKDIIEYLQQISVMQTLMGRNDRFLKRVNDLLLQQQIGHRDFGILSWAPKLADEYKSKDLIREISARYESSSEWEGAVGDKVSMMFTLIESRYIKNQDCYIVYGYNQNNNLIFYWAKEMKKIVKSGMIKGRIKDHRRDEFRGNCKVTVLNFVKIV